MSEPLWEVFVRSRRGRHPTFYQLPAEVQHL